MASQDGKIRKDDLVQGDALKVYDELEAKAKKALKGIATELDKLSKAERKVGITTKQSNTIEKQRIAELKKAEVEVKKLERATKQATKARLREADAIDRNKKALDKQRKSTEKATKANKGLTTTFKNLLRSMVAFIGVRMFIQAGKDVFNLTRQLSSLQFAMKAVIKDEFELSQTTIWLKEITNAYGAELVTTTERYIKFRAASIQAGLSSKETQKIFESMTKAAGVLGLKTDELRGIYLALEQMISKGKITTEELRRQLGERLPGAMDIMAQSLGITTSKLDDMMKKGLVISKDVLPKFAEQVEIAFGIENVKKVDTLAASTERLANSWSEFIISLEGSEGGLSSFFSFFIRGTETILRRWSAVNTVMKSDIDFWTKFSSISKPLFTFGFGSGELDELATQIEYENTRNILLKEANRLFQEKSNKLAPLLALGEAEINLNKLNNEQLQIWIDSMNAVPKAIENAKEGTVAWYRKEIEEIQKLIESESERKDIIPIQEKINKLQKELNALLGIEEKIKKKKKEEIIYLFGSIGYLEQMISKNEKLIKQATNQKTRDKLIEENKALREMLKNLNGIVDKSQELAATKPIGFLVDTELQKASLEEILDLASQFNNALGGFADALSSRKIEAIEAEMIAEENKYDRLLALAGDDASQKLALEREKDVKLALLEKKRLKEEQKAAKRRKVAALADIAINTAVAYTKTLAQGGAILGIPLANLVLALGAIQAATVLAQPIPQYKDGLDYAKNDHTAMINDGGRREFVERNGVILSTPIKNAVVDLQKGDKVHKDMDALMNASIMTSLANDNKNLDANRLKAIFDTNYNGLESAITKGFNKAKINNSIKLNGFDSGQEAYKQSQSRWN